MCARLTLKDSRNAISSPELAVGASHFGGPGGQMTVPPGRGVAPANLSARQAKEAALLTSGICGQRSNGLSNSEHLTSFLANRLRAKTASLGSTLYKLTWKERVMPSGRRICALRASVPRISDHVCIGARSGWPTATSRDWKDGANPNVNVQLNALLGRVSWLAGWPTRTATDAARGSGTIRAHDTGIPLPQRASMIDRDSPARLTATGNLLTGSDAEMTGGGPLNPAHSRWLMGYPPEWDSCGATVTLSSRKSRQK